MSENLKVLVVHRHASVTDDIKKQFDRAGWLVHLAHSGLDGLLAARKESFGLILSAIDLPVITGIEMMRAIRNFSFNVNTPAVFIDKAPDGHYNGIFKKLRVKVHFAETLDWSQLSKMYDSPQSRKSFLRLEPVDDSLDER